MKNSEEIKIEINQTTERLNELFEQQTAASGTLQEMQTGFIARTVSLDDLQAQQSRVTVLNASIEALEARRTELEADLETSEKAAARHSVVNSLAEAAAATEKEFSAHRRISDELNNLLDQKSGELLDHVSAVIENRQKFRQLFSSVARRGDGSFQAAGGPIHLSPELMRELKEAGATEEQIRAATADFLEEPKGEFAGVVKMAMEMQSNRRYAFNRELGVLE